MSNSQALSAEIYNTQNPDGTNLIPELPDTMVFDWLDPARAHHVTPLQDGKDHGHPYKLNAPYNLVNTTNPPRITELRSIHFVGDDDNPEYRPPLQFIDIERPSQPADFILRTNTDQNNRFFNVYPDGVRRTSTLSDQEIRDQARKEDMSRQISNIDAQLDRFKRQGVPDTAPIVKQLTDEKIRLERVLNPNLAVVDELKQMQSDLSGFVRGLRETLPAQIEMLRPKIAAEKKFTELLGKRKGLLTEEMEEIRRQMIEEKQESINDRIAFFEDLATRDPEPMVRLREVGRITQERINEISETLGKHLDSRINEQINREVAAVLQDISADVAAIVEEEKLSAVNAQRLHELAVLDTIKTTLVSFVDAKVNEAIGELNITEAQRDETRVLVVVQDLVLRELERVEGDVNSATRLIDRVKSGVQLNEADQLELKNILVFMNQTIGALDETALNQIVSDIQPLGESPQIKEEREAVKKAEAGAPRLSGPLSLEGEEKEEKPKKKIVGVTPENIAALSELDKPNRRAVRKVFDVIINTDFKEAGWMGQQKDVFVNAFEALIKSQMGEDDETRKDLLRDEDEKFSDIVADLIKKKIHKKSVEDLIAKFNARAGTSLTLPVEKPKGKPKEKPKEKKLKKREAAAEAKETN